MNKLSLDKETLILLYRKHKDYIVSVAIIIVCFILLIQVTIPQIADLSVRQQEVKTEKDKLNSLSNNLSILSSITQDSLDQELSLTTSALPIEKNFTGILNSVTIGANKSGVFLGDYEFQVGDLSKTTVIGKSLPSLQLSLSVNGGVNGAIKFIAELYKSLPLAEISNVEINNSRSVISVVFYYKSYNGGANVSSPLAQISKNDSATLSQISGWNNGNGQVQPLPLPAVINTASPSATPTPSSPF